MTSPIVIRQPGVGEQIQQGLAPLLQALQFQQRQALQQQQLDLQQQQVEQQGIQQRSLDRDRAQDRVLQLMEMFGEGVLDDPAVQEQINQFGPGFAGRLKKLFGQRQKEAEAGQKAINDAFVSSLPPALQTAGKAAVNAFPLLGKQGADAIFDIVADNTQLTEEEEIALRGEFPEFSNLPTRELIKQVTSIRALQAQVRLQIGPEARRQSQTRLDAARTELSKLNRRLKAGGGDKFNVARQIMQLTNDANDPLQIIGLMMNPGNEDLLQLTPDQRIGRLFGAQALEATIAARKIVFGELSRQQP